MKKLLFFCLLIALLTSIHSQAYNLPKVLFILPGDQTYVASRTYNYFTQYYRGNAEWVLKSAYTKDMINRYDAIVSIDETVGRMGMVSVSVEIVYDGGQSFSSDGGRYNSNFSMNTMYNLQAMKHGMDLLKSFDPEVYNIINEEMKDIVGD
jgi:predicted heme/steroid binding protein